MTPEPGCERRRGNRLPDGGRRRQARATIRPAPAQCPLRPPSPQTGGAAGCWRPAKTDRDGGTPSSTYTNGLRQVPPPGGAGPAHGETRTGFPCRIGQRAKKQGVRVAWLTVDEDDAPGLFGAHLAYAFEHAGLGLAAQKSKDAWTASSLTHQIGTLVRVIETHPGSCLLVLDELERLPARSVELERLLRHGPRNLHFALSFRINPGLDLASVVLEDSAVVVTTEQFRFSKPEIARFFGGDLTRRELNDIADRSARWPVALRIDRSMWASGAAESVEQGKALIRNFLDARLLRGLSDPDRGPASRPGGLRLGRHETGDEVLESRHALASRGAGGAGRTPDVRGRRRAAAAPVAEGALRPPARR